MAGDLNLDELLPPNDLDSGWTFGQLEEYANQLYAALKLLHGHDREYRVIWQREGQTKKRALYQTLEGAEICAGRQLSARDDMDWLPEPLAEIVYGPIIEARTVSSWSPVGPR